MILLSSGSEKSASLKFLYFMKFKNSMEMPNSMFRKILFKCQTFAVFSLKKTYVCTEYLSLCTEIIFINLEISKILFYKF